MDPLEPGKGTENTTPYSCAIGLALEEMEKEHHINLIPEEIYERYAAAHRKRFVFNTLFLVFINIFLLGGWAGHAFWHRQQTLDIYRDKIAKIQPKIADIKKIQEKQAITPIVDASDLPADQKQAIIAENMDLDNTAFAVMSDVFLRTRDRVRIRQVTFKKSESVDMDLEVFDPQDQVDYVKDLGESPHFCGVESGRLSIHRWPKNYGDNLVTQDVSGLTATICKD